MKKLLFALFTMLLTTVNAQSYQTDIYHSLNKQTGINIYHISKNGFTLGLGGSYLFSTYTGETGGKYQELANVSLGSNGNSWSNAFRTNYQVRNFTENRGTVKLLIGKTVNKTTVLATTGLSFRSEYWAGRGYDFLPEFTSPERYFYVYRNISPTILYGINISHRINHRYGIHLGYDNISKITYGITINLKDSGLFQD